MVSIFIDLICTTYSMVIWQKQWWNNNMAPAKPQSQPSLETSRLRRCPSAHSSMALQKCLFQVTMTT